MSEDSTAEWCAAVGYRSDHHETPEYTQSRHNYVKLLWDAIADPAAPPLDEKQVRSRLAALRQVLVDLEGLVVRARSDEIRGPDNKAVGGGEWSFPLSAATEHPMGELRQPREGCDAWSMHHRAYFGAPTVWPGSIVWGLLAFKPDVSIDPNWHAIQDASIEAADDSVTRYIADTDGAADVRSDVPPL